MARSGTHDSKTKKTGSRGERLAAELRENLRRRKAQERRRGALPVADAPAKPGPTPAGFAKGPQPE